MGQQEVRDFLKKNKGKEFTITDLEKNLNQGRSSLTSNLRKLRGYEEIKFKKVPGIPRGFAYLYSYKK